jgi:hypothetical protein
MADYYGTLADAEDYHTARGNVAWTASGVTNSQREAAMLRASEALDGIYGRRFTGRKVSRSQVRAWPRYGAEDLCSLQVIPDDEVPTEIEHASYTLALQELLNPNSSTPILTLGRITKMEKVDVIQREFMTGADGVNIDINSLRPTLTAVEDALSCLVTQTTAGVSQQNLLRY